MTGALKKPKAEDTQKAQAEEDHHKTADDVYKGLV